MRTIAALTIAGLTGSTLAAPINPDHVPPSATWVAHIDLDAMRNSTLVQSIENVNEVFEQINDQLAGEFDIDLQADLTGVTAFGRGELGDEENLDGVILYGSAGLQELIRLIEQEVPDHTRRTIGDQLVYEFAIDDDEAFGSLHVDVAETKRPEDVAISPWTLHVAPTIDKRNDLDEMIARNAGGNDLADNAPRGAMVYVAANRLDQIIGDDGDDPASMFLSSAESLTLSIAEVDQRFELHAALVTADVQAATDLKQMGDGFLAMARIAAANDPDVQAALELSKHLSLTADGRTVHLAFSAPVDVLIDAVGELDSGSSNVIIEIDDDDHESGVRIEKDIQIQRQ